MTTERLADALLSCLPRGAAVVSVGLMRGAMIDAFAELRGDLRIVDLVSEAALAAHPTFAPVALIAAGGRAVAEQDGEYHVAPQRRVGPGLVEARAVSGRLLDLRRLLSGLRDPALLHFAPIPGHDALLRYVLPVVHDLGILTWWTIGEDSAAAVLGAAAAAGLVVYRFDADGRPLPECAGGGAATALLVPRAAWNPHGLDRIFAGLPAAAPLVVPTTRGHTAALLDLLPAIPAARPARPALTKRFVPVGSHVLADAGATVEIDGTRYLRIGRRRTVTLVFMPPFGGPCDAGLVLGARVSDGHAAALRIGTAGAEARLTWVEEWYQLRLGLPALLDPARGPVALTLRDLRPGGGGQDALLIKGVEVVALQGAEVAPLEPEPLHAQSATRRLAS